MIRKIFRDDLIGLFKNFFALVIVVGICFLPALYAWFNIYSNWDPYGSTDQLKLAAISLDEGYTDEDGTYHNQGKTIIENLHDNKSVDWQFVDSLDEAKEGVYSGKYYAAIVVDQKFTYNMYHVFSDKIQSPSLIFYENQKKNPVATKISDTVVQTLQNKINASFVEVVMTQVFSGAGNAYSDVKKESDVDDLYEKLSELHTNLNQYQTTVNQIIEADAALQKALKEAKGDAQALQDQANQSSKSVDESKDSVKTTMITLNSYSEHVNNTLAQIETTLTTMERELKSATLSTDAKKTEEILKQTATDASALAKYAQTLSNALPTNLPGDISKVTSLLSYAQSLETILNVANAMGSPLGDSISKSETSIANTVAQANEQVKNIRTHYNENVIPQVNAVLTQLQDTMSNTSALLTQMANTFGSLTGVFDSLDGTLDSANSSLAKTSDALTYLSNRLAIALDKAKDLKGNEKLAALIGTLSGDSEAYGAFIASPVTVSTEAIYPIENYGSAVAPFYSTLAFWVGALILTAIIKVHPDKKKYPTATPTQMYFGRYILYWILGQIQAMIIVAGDIYLLKIQCLHPGWFFLAASMIATTFTIFIYSLVVTWGDAGKALAVVIVVIQIAGSSGTYPIELLPSFFKNVYIFFPFPYAINSIRECLCGMYEMDYLKYLMQLSIFIVVALVIGLLVRIPFEGINHYMEERMEDTEMM